MARSTGHVNDESAYRSAERFDDVLSELGMRVHATPYAALPAATRERLDLALLDLMGVALAGMRTPELVALVAAAVPSSGPHPLLGTDRRVGPVDSAWFPAVAAACLELDEGNKHAVGHPAAHVFFTAVAAARAASRPVSGERFLTAVAGGYEIAARAGRALRRDPRWHTHGHWGVLGSAWAAAYVGGADAATCVRAAGSAGSLMRVTPWQAVLDGDVTRNLWMADAVPAGLRAAQLAAAGLAPPPAAARHGLSLVGEVDVDALGRDPERRLCGEGYLKLHSACSYTHPAIDLTLQLRPQLPNATRVRVRTNSLAAPLVTDREPGNRLAAMFSLPFVVATAWSHGEVTPEVMDPAGVAFAESRALLDRVEVTVDTHLDRWLPDRRVAWVSLVDGTQTVTLCAPNPIGDSDYFPLDAAAVHAKLVRLIGAADTERIGRVMAALTTSPDVAALLVDLP